MRILFCTDGSDVCNDAFYNASSFIKEAQVDSICVIDWSFLPPSMNIESENYSTAYEAIADGILAASENMIEEKGLTVGHKIKIFGSAVEGILEQLDKVVYDLVILGSHGKKGIQKWLGSVSRQVISNTIVPVFISKKLTKNKKVLLTVDGSEPSFNAIKSALKLFDLKDKEIYVISVKESPELLPLEASMDKNWLDSIEKQQRIHAAKAINKAKTIMEEVGIQVQNEVILTGNPAQKIIDIATDEKMDLIIMGARTKTDLSKLLLGSVSKRVLENTNSGVLLISK